MRVSTITIAAALCASHAGNAFAPHKGGDLPVVAAGRQPRLHRTTAWTAPATAQRIASAGGEWRGIWDRDTDVPLRMWGPSIAVAHSTSDAGIAETAARSFLAAHLATLAPGAIATDFVLVANQLDGNIRTLGFQQQSHGVPVVGGTVGVIFERDHLVMVTSTALPNIVVRMPIGPLAAGIARDSATSWLGQDGVAVTVRSEAGRVIVPIVHARGNRATPDIEYRVADTVSVEAERGAGSWTVWVDAGDGAPIARATTTMFASGIVNFDVPDRYPLSTRSPHPAPNAISTVNGVQVQSDLTGTVTWASGAATVAPGLAGPLLKLVNKAGTLATATPPLALADGGSVTWSMASDAASDAQLDTFVFASTAKHFVLTRMNPNATATSWLNAQITANVNVSGTCNAFFSDQSNSINFYPANAQCENTGRIADVVYHEFGHGVHANSFIQGVGAFDGSLSEGLADTLAVSITGDHGMGRGFFFNDQALRDVDPVGTEKKWPDDADGEVHDEGEIIGEALYDVRKALQAKLGDGPGFEKFLVIYYGVLQRAADIPTSISAVLLADDDNGDLSDGTPNQCEIQAAMGLHGLADPSASLGLKPPTRDGFTVSIKVAPPASGACAPATVSAATLTWQLQTGGTPADIALSVGGDGVTYAGVIPTQPDGSVVLYHVTIALSDGSSITYPQNPADPDYQMYVGNVQVIKCFDFEAGIGDWTHSANPTTKDEWEAGPPLGIGGDPTAAHGGANVLGIDLGDTATGDGMYSNRTKQWAISPAIDLGGETQVRLQYYRWLGVEDGAYDNAIIYANDMEMWTNHASAGMPTTEVNHTDREWRFQDVDLGPAASTGSITLKFELDSDPGLAFGGWTVDDVCIVKVVANAQLCGNGTVDPGESCDDGNHVDGDGCSSACAIEACADSGGGGGPCDGAGCCSSTQHPAGPIVLSVLVIGGLVIRRRRRA